MPEIDWHGWAATLAWTIGTLAVAWGIGRVLSAVLRSRGTRWLAGFDRPWAETALRVVHRRLPWWFLLLGAWLAAGFWPLTPEGRVLVGRLVFAIVAGSITFAAAAVASRMVDSYGSLVAPALPVSSLTRNVAWGVTAVLGLLVILNGLGLSIAPMLAALGVGGIAVALALQEPLANFFAGIFIVLAGQIRVGDYVKLDSGHEGYVVDFSWRSTRLRMLANNVVIVPNAKLAQATIVNHHLPSQDLAVLVEVGVDYASDLGHVERVVIDVARQVMAEVPGGVPEFQPFVRFHTFNDSSIDFSVIMRGKEYTDQFLVKHEFVRRLHERFDREGIVIPFPIRTIAQREAAAPSHALGASGSDG
ncbi:MAG TPA: mechanosensitive ion channel family protein [Vicinamibacterales bacterium]|nr:mechanosensitive ion channel family protein [Vicinamibacterales bacterium]